VDEKDLLIQRIEQGEHDLIRLIARDRCGGLFTINLTMQQIRALLVLDVEESLPVHELADRLGVGLATITGIVDRLVAQDLVLRRPDPDDRRIRRVEPTAAGRRAIEELGDAGRDRKRRVFRRLDLDTLRDFARVMEAVHEAAAAEIADGAGDPPG